MEVRSFNFQPEKSQRNIFFWIFLFGLVFLVGFAGVLAARIWDPPWNPFRPSPERVVKRMILEMGKIKTFQEKTEFFLKASSKESEFELKINSEGKTDATQKEKPKHELTFNTILSLRGKEEPMGLKFVLDGEIKAIEETIYLKLTKLPDFFLAMVGLDFSQIKDQWIKIDEESMINLLKKTEAWDPVMEKQYLEEKEKQEKLEKQLQEEIERLLREEKWFFVKKQFPDKKINGIKVYHYSLSLNNEIIVEILKKIEEVMIAEYGFFPTFEKEQIKEFLDKKIGEINFEVWIGKKDYLLYRVKGEKALDLAKFVKEMEGEIVLGFTLEHSKFNQPVKIETPTEYKDLGEILGPLFEEYIKSLEELPLPIEDKDLEKMEFEMKFPMEEKIFHLQASILEGFLKMFKK